MFPGLLNCSWIGSLGTRYPCSRNECKVKLKPARSSSILSKKKDILHVYILGFEFPDFAEIAIKLPWYLKYNFNMLRGVCLAISSYVYLRNQEVWVWFKFCWTIFFPLFLNLFSSSKFAYFYVSRGGLEVVFWFRLTAYIFFVPFKTSGLYISIVS